MATNPEISPVIANSCLQTIREESLSSDLKCRMGNKEYIVCRVLNEASPEELRSYDIDKAIPAVIGIVWANKNHQPMDYPRDRCIVEARIWSAEIAKEVTSFILRSWLKAPKR